MYVLYKNHSEQMLTIVQHWAKYQDINVKLLPSQK